MTETLDERKKEVLRIVVESFIRGAEPISSKAVAEVCSEPVSSATVRNEMAALMDMGYLAQTHTSSGRVPTDAGYRYYVDHLAQGSETLTDNEIRMIRDSMDIMQYRLEILIRSICKTISEYTKMITLASMPDVQECVVTHFEIGRVASRHCLMVVMLSTGEVINRMVRMPFDISVLDITHLSRRLASRIMGQKVSDLKEQKLDSIFTEVELREISFRLALKQFLREVAQEKMLRLQILGQREILSQPELKDLSQFKNLMKVMDDVESVSRLVDMAENQAGDQGAKASRVTIKIGHENPIEELSDYSFISCHYQAENINLEGIVGLLGPKRMNYGKLIELLQFAANKLGEKIKGFDFLSR